MPLTREGQLANLVRSLDVYLAAEITDVPIDWEGVPFDDASQAEWIQPRLLEPVRPAARFFRQVSGEARGQELALLYNVNIFVRPRLQTSPYRMHTLRDRVLGAFTELTKIPIKDYAGDQSTLGAAVVRLIVTDRRVVDPSLADELLQWTVTPQLAWTEGWTA